MILIQLQQRQTSLEISKIECHLNTEGNGLSLFQNFGFFLTNEGVLLD